MDQRVFSLAAAGKAVGENLIDHCILHPVRNLKPVCPVVERKLKIVASVWSGGKFIAVTVVDEGFFSFGEAKVIGNALQISFKADLVPVKIQIRAYFFHGTDRKREHRIHGSTVGKIKKAAVRLAAAGAQAKDIVGIVQGKGKFASWPVVDGGGVHSFILSQSRRPRRLHSIFAVG